MNCSPSNKNADFTCYSKPQLIKISKILNKSKKYPKITVSNKSKKQLWDQINFAMLDKCNYEWCWLDQKSIKKIPNKILHEYTFKPKKPDEWLTNKNTWLTTTDIREVMIQYEKLYKNFKFYGPIPVDCPTEIYCELSNLNVKRMFNKKINKLGVVFNLDKHNEPGSHWVALLVDVTKNIIVYYDSVGNDPPYHIKRFIDILKKNYKKIDRNMDILVNKKQHQFQGSECGVYSMNFLIESLKGTTFEQFQKKKISDYSVNILRDYLYR